MPSILMTGFTWVTRKTLQYSWYKGVQRTYRTPFYTLPLIINWICTTLSPTSWKMKMGPAYISFISFGGNLLLRSVLLVAPSWAFPTFLWAPAEATFPGDLMWPGYPPQILDPKEKFFAVFWADPKIILGSMSVVPLSTLESEMSCVWMFRVRCCWKTLA